MNCLYFLAGIKISEANLLASRYGIGLYIVIDVESINRIVIEQAIDRFYEIGEKKWQAADTVPREKLPYESERESYAKVDYPSVLLGQKIRGSE